MERRIITLFGAALLSGLLLTGCEGYSGGYGHHANPFYDNVHDDPGYYKHYG